MENFKKTNVQKSIVPKARMGLNALSDSIFGGPKRGRTPATLGRCLNGWCPENPSQIAGSSLPPTFWPRPPYSVRNWEPNNVKRCVKLGNKCPQQEYIIPVLETQNVCAPLIHESEGTIPLKWICPCYDYEEIKDGGILEWTQQQPLFNNLKLKSNGEQVRAIRKDVHTVIGQSTPSGTRIFEITLDDSLDSKYTIQVFQPLDQPLDTRSFKLIFKATSHSGHVVFGTFTACVPFA